MEGLIERLHSIEKRMKQHIDDRFNHLENLINQNFKRMDQAIVNLQAAVQKETTVFQSGVTLIQQLANEIKNAPDMATVQALADQVSANADTLAAAITANTPAQANS